MSLGPDKWRLFRKGHGFAYDPSEPLSIAVQIGDRQYHALVETGAASSIIGTNVVEDLILDDLCVREQTSQRFKLADSSSVGARSSQAFHLSSIFHVMCPFSSLSLVLSMSF